MSDEDLHIDAPLTDISAAYQQVATGYLADQLFPNVPTGKRTAYFDGTYRPPAPQQLRHAQVPMHEINLATGHHPLDQDLIREHVLTLQVGGQLEEVELEQWRISDEEWGESRSGYTLTDGRHRFAAHLIAGSTRIAARIKP